jgi:hypothetical protein
MANAQQETPELQPFFSQFPKQESRGKNFQEQGFSSE